jgi:glycosyltransferase involved in cell wall biosynthesis
VTRIAWFTPFRKPQSAIGQYSAIVVAELRKQAEVTVFASDLADGREAWPFDGELRFIDKESRSTLLESLGRFDVLVYNLGDHYGNHASIYEIAMARPGITILHDLVMNHFFAEYCRTLKQEPERYVHELTYSHGEAGWQLGERVIQGIAGNIWENGTMLRYPMAKSAIRGAHGVIVHSRFAYEAIRAVADSPVRVLAFPQPALLSEGTGAALEHAPATAGKVRLFTFGMINRNKNVELVLRAMAERTLLRERAEYVVLGSLTDAYEAELRVLIERLQLGERVRLLGFQPDAVLHEQMAAADVVINVRNPHFGESSWSLLESCAAGKPTIVWGHGSYAELPDEVVVKVNSEAELRAALERLVLNERDRAAIGERALAYVTAEHATSRYAARLLEFLERVQSVRPSIELADFLSARLGEMGPGVRHTDLPSRVAREIDRIAPREWEADNGEASGTG